MALVYSFDQLLKLRESPLVARPPSLPPTEEWMGPPPEIPPRKARDPNVQSETRPNGPERTSSHADTFFTNTFPSASPRPFGEFGKSGEKPFSRFKTGKDEYNKGEQSNGGRRLFTRDPEQQGEGGERGSFGSGRRGGREERGEFNGQRKTFGEDGERRTWRTGDRDKETRWGQREPREPREQGENKFEKGPRNRDSEGRYSGRRDWMSRDGIQTEGLKDNEEEKPNFKSREWRTGGRDAPRESRDSREWIRGNARVEQDPEWMDAPEPEAEQPNKTHTEEDFRLWKEKMKANTGAPAEERPQVDAETFGSGDFTGQDKTSRHVSGSSKEAEKRVAVQDDFWANFGSDTGFKDERKSETPNPAEQAVPSIAPTKKSRFFTKSEAPPVSVPTPPASTQPERPASTGKSADQEGLSNLMKMLGMTGPPAPQATRTPSSMSEQSIPPKQSARASEGPGLRDTQSPGLPSFFNDDRAPPPPQRMDSSLMQQARPEPPRQQSQGQESFLLGLLQTSKGPRHATPQSLSPAPGLPGHGQIPGVLRVPGLSQQQQQQGSVYLDDPAIASVARPSHNEPRENIRNMSHGNVPLGFFDDKQFPPQGRDAHMQGHPQIPGMPNFPQSLAFIQQHGQNPGNGGSALPQAMHDLAARRMNPSGFPGNMVGHQGNNSLPPTPLDRPGQILPQQQLQHQMQQQQQQAQAQHRQQPRGPLGFAPPGLEPPSRGAPPPGMMIPPGFMDGSPGPQGFFGMGGQMSEAAAISLMQQQQAAQQAQQRPQQPAPGLRDQLFPGGAGPRIHPDLLPHGYGVGPPQGGRGGAPPPGPGPAGMMPYR